MTDFFPCAYLCGGIFELTDANANDWRETARGIFLAVGWHVIDPMARDYRGKEDESVRAIVSGDVADIIASTAVLVNATRPSWGTAMEIPIARQFGKQVHAFVGRGGVSPWLRYFCTSVSETLEGACAALLGQ